MGFGEAIKTAFRKYVDFTGYSSRSEYWWFVLFYFLVAIVARLVDAGIGAAMNARGFSVFNTVWVLAALLPGLALVVRRLRDAGYAWPWLFILLVPIAGLIVFIVLVCQPSKQRVLGESVTPAKQVAPTLDASSTMSRLMPNPRTEERRSARSWGKRGLVIGAAALAVVLGIGGFYFGSRSSGQARQNVNGAPDPAATDLQTSAVVAAPTPEATQPAIDTNTITPVAEIPASITPLKMGELVVQEARVDWRNAGVASALAADQSLSGTALDGYANSIATQQAGAYEKALFMDGWQGRSDIVDYENQIQMQNAQNIVLSHETLKDPIPFQWGVDSGNVVVTSYGDSQIDLIIKFREFQNAALNGAGPLASDLAQNESTYQRMDVKLLKFGNVMKISAISVIPDPSR